MAKLTLVTLPDPVADPAGFVSAYNENCNRIEAAFVKTLSRDGSVPNLIETTIDFGGVDIVNGPVVAPDIYLTSRPYPVIFSDSFDLRSTGFRYGFMDIGLIQDRGDLNLTALLTFGNLQITVGYKEYSYGPSKFDPENIDLSADLRTGSLEITVGYKSYSYGPTWFDPEQMDLSADLRSGNLQIVANYIDYLNWPVESLDLSCILTSGTLT